MKNLCAFLFLLSLFFVGSAQSSQNQRKGMVINNFDTLSQFRNAVSDKKGVDTFQAASLATHTLIDGISVIDRILAGSRYQGLIGLCSITSNNLKREYSLEYASTDTCVRVLKSAIANKSSRVRAVFKSVYNVHLDMLIEAPHSLEWRNSFIDILNIAINTRELVVDAENIPRKVAMSPEAQLAYLEVIPSSYINILDRQPHFVSKVCELASKAHNRRGHRLHDRCEEQWNETNKNRPK